MEELSAVEKETGFLVPLCKTDGSQGSRQVSIILFLEKRQEMLLNMGTLEGLLSCQEFWPQSSCPRVGLKVKFKDTVKK